MKPAAASNGQGIDGEQMPPGSAALIVIARRAAPERPGAYSSTRRPFPTHPDTGPFLGTSIEAPALKRTCWYLFQLTWRSNGLASLQASLSITRHTNNHQFRQHLSQSREHRSHGELGRDVRVLEAP